jgi:hypothetical protein
MPREIYLVSRDPMTLPELVEAAVAVDGTLVPRLLNEGAAIQLVDLDDVAVITLDSSRLIRDTTDLERITGPLPAITEVWWTEATAPWGRAGEPGVAVARVLAERLGARISVEDGTAVEDSR